MSTNFPLLMRVCQSSFGRDHSERQENKGDSMGRMEGKRIAETTTAQPARIRALLDARPKRRQRRIRLIRDNVSAVPSHRSTVHSVI